MLQGGALAEYLRGEPWESLYYQPPGAALSVVGMISHFERKMLSWLTARHFVGWGEIVELGVFIGSSSVCLASGLDVNERAEKREKRIHAFDRFSGEFESNWISTKSKFQLDPDGGFRGVYDRQTEPFSKYIDVNAGDLLNKKWSGVDVEILFVDVMKSQALTDKVVRDFFPYLVPGRSVLIMQDYLFQALPYSVVVMELFEEYFERAGDTGRNSVLFVNTKKIPGSLLEGFSWKDLPLQVRLTCLMNALPKQRTHIQREFVAHQIADFISGKHR